MNVFDASALMALLDAEEGSADIRRFVEGSLISTVNLAEVLQKTEHRGMPTEAIAMHLGEMDMGIVPFDDDMALISARIWSSTRARGLSLADRACLALAIAVNGVAVTTDAAWAGLEIDGLDIHVVRR